MDTDTFTVTVNAAAPVDNTAPTGGLDRAPGALGRGHERRYSLTFRVTFSEDVENVGDDAISRSPRPAAARSPRPGVSPAWQPRNDAGHAPAPRNPPRVFRVTVGGGNLGSYGGHGGARLRH